MSIYGNTTKFPMTPFVFDNIYMDDIKDIESEEKNTQYKKMTIDVEKGVYLANRYLLYKVIDEDEATGKVKYLYGQVFRVVANETGLQIELVATLNAPSFTVNQELNFAKEGLNPERRISGDNAENKVDIILPEDSDHLTFQLEFTITSIGKMCSNIWDMLLGTNRNGYLDGWDDSHFNNLGGAIGALYNLMGKEQIKTINENDVFPPFIKKPEDYIYYMAGSKGGGDYYGNPIETGEYYYLIKTDEYNYSPIKLEGFAGGMQNLYKDLVNIKQLMGFFDPNTLNTETVQGCINKMNDLFDKFEATVLSIKALEQNVEITSNHSVDVITSIDGDNDEHFSSKFTLSGDIDTNGAISIGFTQTEDNNLIIDTVGKKHEYGEIFGVNNTIQLKNLYNLPSGNKVPIGRVEKVTDTKQRCYLAGRVYYKYPSSGEDVIISLNNGMGSAKLLAGDYIPDQITNVLLLDTTWTSQITTSDFIDVTSKNSENWFTIDDKNQNVYDSVSVEGYRNIAHNDINGQKIIGRFNDPNKSGVLFAVGNGTSDNDRSNAFTVYEDGSIEIGNEIQNIILEEGITDPGSDTKGISTSIIKQSAIAKISGNQFTVHGLIQGLGMNTTVEYTPDWTKLLEKIKKTNGVDIERIYNICLTPISRHIITLGRSGVAGGIWARLEKTDFIEFYFTIEGYVSTWGNPINTTEEE